MEPHGLCCDPPALAALALSFALSTAEQVHALHLLLLRYHLLRLLQL